MPTVSRYDQVARLLHWSIALLILTLLAMGMSFDSIPKGSFKMAFISLHETLGLLTLALVVVRIFWRMGHRPPADTAWMPGWQRLSAHVVHALLYFAMFLMPVSGYLFVNYKFGVAPFGVHLPQFGAPNPALNHLFRHLHGFLGNAFYVLLALHIGAALWHHFYQKDGTLKRML